MAECQDEAFKILRRVKHACSSTTKAPPIWIQISTGRPESRDHFGTNIVIYNALCTVCAQYMLLTEFGVRFFFIGEGSGSRRKLDGIGWTKRPLDPTCSLHRHAGGCTGPLSPPRRNSWVSVPQLSYAARREGVIAPLGFAKAFHFFPFFLRVEGPLFNHARRSSGEE